MKIEFNSGFNSRNSFKRAEKMDSIAVFVLVALSVAVNAETDYCSRELTCGNDKNIMCNAQQTFGPLCDKASSVSIDDEIRNQFLKGHNERRSFVAQGKLGGFFKPAVRMATITWDAELERMALQNVLQCEMKHDQCRRTKHFVYAGQNLASGCQSPTYGDLHAAIEGTMKSWYDEYSNLPAQWLNSYGNGPQPQGQVGHFTQVVRDKAFAMGCAIVKSISHDGGLWNCYYIACNYATTNMIGAPVYEIGEMGKKCRSGMNSNYPGLCSEREDYYDDKVLFH
ncbi:venom allergen 3-like [Sitodiplosis mosellana]|uniref:venom allergen 3-like n=1 Tax=Sitodiplosis mosellana TaxID=263140 RepID=UPI002444A64C|nr:venom allergen 3-like [Sitodiplosis mosellana]